MSFQLVPLGRREVLAGAAALAVAAASGDAAAQPVGAETARGTVYDADSNPRRGLPGVMVSNGGDVVKTDAQGRWSLPVRSGDSLFVIKPSGWAPPVDPATNLPRFTYVHVPEGTPDLGFRFAGVAPTGKLPESIDFPLHRRPEQARFSAILFGDPQPESLTEVDFIRDDVVGIIEKGDTAFGITHGDLMFDDLSNYPRYNRIVGSIGVPWYNCPGNHDMNLEAPDDVLSRETFKRTFGTRCHAFQYGNATFIVLDNVDYLGTDPAKPNGYGKYRGFFGDRQLGFVRSVLANVPREQLVVFSFHIPLRTIMGTAPAVAAVDLKEFLMAISTHPHSVSFSGHTHTNEHWYFSAADGFAAGTHHHHVLGTVSGSWWSGPLDPRGIPMAMMSDGTPNGYHMLSVDGADYATTLVAAHDPARGQMRMVLDSQVHADGREMMTEYPAGALQRGPISAERLASTRLVVNLFDGGPRSKVDMSIAGGPARALQKVERLDPYVVEVFARNERTRKPWVMPVKSAHLWETMLPADLAPGIHRITVRGIDEYGREQTSEMVLEVV